MVGQVKVKSGSRLAGHIILLNAVATAIFIMAVLISALQIFLQSTAMARHQCNALVGGLQLLCCSVHAMFRHLMAAVVTRQHWCMPYAGAGLPDHEAQSPSTGLHLTKSRHMERTTVIRRQGM